MTSQALVILFLALAAQAQFAYDEEFAKEYTAISFAAECSDTSLEQWDVGYVSRLYPNVRKVTVYKNTAFGTMGYVGYNANRGAIFFVFRGSENIQNWIENIDFVKSSFNDECNCKVHSGFKDAYLTLKAQVFEQFDIYRKQYPTAQIHVTGHSLGGAMATLLAVDIARLGFQVRLVTLGSPRVGDPSFYDYFQKQPISHFRLVHEADIVPHLPPHTFSFYHVDREIWYHDDQSIICQPIRGEDKTCSYSVVKTSRADHSTYIGLSSSVDCN
ncbi:hypothetical protein pb186bvf_020633 [Paramecium bursaria]